MFLKKKVIIVEDNDEDFFLARRGLDLREPEYALERFDNGDDAFDFIQDLCEEDFSDPPVLFVLDLNLPGANGFDILKEIKSDLQLRKIPVIVFSSSNYEKDVSKCYEVGANCYIQKPNDVQEFKETMGHIRSYWIERAILPHSSFMSDTLPA